MRLLYCFGALLTNTIEYRSERIERKSVLFREMTFYLFKLLAVEMDELSTFFTFAVEAYS